MTIPITWQIVVHTHEGEHHLFQRNAKLPGMPHKGMLLGDVDGVPNVVGPDAGCDNIICRVLYNGKTKRFMCLIQGYRAATQNREEVQQELPGWTYVTQLENVSNVGPEDLLKD